MRTFRFFMAFILGVVFIYCAFPINLALAEKVLKVGEAAPLSGRAATWGLACERGARLAVEEINEQGGFNVAGESCILKLFSVDNKYTTAGGRQAGERLVYQEKVNVLCSMGTEGTLALQEISEPKKIPLFTAAFSRQATNPKKKYTFSHSWGPSELAGIYLPYMKRNHGVEKIVFLGSDSERSTNFSKDSKPFLKKYGIECIGEEYFARGTKDYYPILQKLMRKKPDAIVLCVVAMGSSTIIAKQAGELGYKGIICDPTSRTPRKMLKISGKNIPTYLYWCAVDWEDKGTRRELREFYKKYKSKYNDTPSAMAVGDYDSVYLYVKAVKECGSLDGDKVVKYIENMDPIPTLYGDAHMTGAEYYGINHHISKPLALMVFDSENKTMKNRGMIAPMK